MGSRSSSSSSFSGLTMVVVVMMLITILYSSHTCRASVLIKANATYGGVMTAELLIYPDVTRYLMYDHADSKTGKTKDKEVVVCDNGKGNSFSGCGGSSSNKKQCNAYGDPKDCI
ncbi:hypothetical protein Csa_007870 [Cucumis sativus]|uniref:Uncharacterized protein n=1 Tax=Cucumis sativus TaxID=3659 RepID=A0A0A0KSJ4_CUCSA|nr:hypothetical protein Csa_007870 [Cucumis sativus]